MHILENRCPHSIAVVDASGRERTIPKSGLSVRIETMPGPIVGFADGIPVHAPPRWKGIAHLPPLREGVTIIVSQIVALAIAALHPDRWDVVYPGTAPADGASRRLGRGVVCVSRLIRAV
jgi:hypothetical protein